ncbi:MAG: hypothetical protein QG670_2079 [Thermoproteota archaeon]|nr:hypothetical protein [Thermoproteota archaeon]
MKSLIVCFSYHHNNTQKIAEVMAKMLDAQVKPPEEVSPEELLQFDLVGFGSGIYGEKYHEHLLEFVDRLLHVTNKKAFIFSTSSMEEAVKNHLLLREKLKSKGYTIVDEFNCRGFNTNSFLKLFGGLNKGRPNADDLKHAKEFAMNLAISNK